MPTSNRNLNKGGVLTPGSESDSENRRFPWILVLVAALFAVSVTASVVSFILFREQKNNRPGLNKPPASSYQTRRAAR
jgi:hypothetical protein